MDPKGEISPYEWKEIKEDGVAANVDGQIQHDGSPAGAPSAWGKVEQSVCAWRFLPR